MNLLKHTTAFKMEQFMRSLEAEINRVLAEKHELEAENTASMTEIANLRAENERLSTKLSNTANARILQGKVIVELCAENERLRWMVRRLQERTRQLIQDNKLLAHDDTAEWCLEELMKDVGDSND